MKKLFGIIPITLLIVFACECSGGTTHRNADTAGSPATTDTMPVVHPGDADSSSVIKTSPVNDSNVVKPDSSVKNK